jgi:NAD(P)-dependent dehydrogenase (short-subunit alcohol dehydrogenase family)
MTERIAVVTGGGRGIGRAIAEALGGAGFRVAILARTRKELDETVAAIGTNAGAFPCDVTDGDVVRRVIEQVGAVDVLVNNAGVLGPLRPLVDSDPEDWWRGMEVNLRGPMLMTHAVLPGMIARRRGRIINVSSGGGTAAPPYFSSYITSKTALIRFTECVAAEVKAFGIAVFSISPGTVRSAMTEISLNSEDGKRWLPWFKKIFDEGLDLSPDKAAGLVLQLASGKADALRGDFWRQPTIWTQWFKRLRGSRRTISIRCG